MTVLDKIISDAALRVLWNTDAFPGRWRVQRWAQGQVATYSTFAPRRVQMDGFEFLVDAAANIEVFINGITPSSPIEQIIRAHVRPGDTVLDIGANLGWTARLMSSLVGPGGRVHAFEPIPSALANLRLNVEGSPLKNIVAHATAASDACGHVDLYLEADDATALATMRPPEAGAAAHALRVQTVTLDSLLDQFPKVAFAKIDVEGAEHKVLQGMERLIARDRPMLAIELSDEWLRRLGSSAQALVDHVHARGYDVFRYRGGARETLTEVPHEQVDVVCIARP